MTLKERSSYKPGCDIAPAKRRMTFWYATFQCLYLSNGVNPRQNPSLRAGIRDQLQENSNLGGRLDQALLSRLVVSRVWLRLAE
jgi:hypothetical protein